MRSALFLLASCLVASGQGFGASPAFTAEAQGLNPINDGFSVDGEPPLSSPRQCDSGYGSWTVTDTDSLMGVAGGKLFLNERVSATYGDPGIVSVDNYSFIPGRGVFATYYTTNNGSARIGWNLTGQSYPSTVGAAIAGYSYAGWLTTSINTSYECAVILRGDRGCMLLIRGGAYTDWRLATVLNNTTGNYQQDAYAWIGTYTWGGTIDNAFVADLDGPWATTGCFGVASAHIAAPSNPQSETGTANGTAACNWRAASGETFELTFRQSDADNKLMLRAIQATSQLITLKVVAGEETLLKTNTTTFTDGTEYYITACLNGSSIQPLVNGVFKLATSDSFNSTATGIGCAGGATMEDLTMWPLTISLSIRPTMRHAQVNVWAYGDSKVAAGDTAPWQVGYMGTLVEIGNCAEVPAKVSHGGYYVRTGAASFTNVIDADLAAAVGTPNFVCLNIGVNDAASGIGSTDWPANYRYVLDAIHTQWPDAKVGCMLPWSTNAAMATWDAMAGEITTACSERTPWAVVGPDERVFLENGDNGATYTDDGLHPNHAGHVLTAEQWRYVFGL